MPEVVLTLRTNCTIVLLILIRIETEHAKYIVQKRATSQFWVLLVEWYVNSQATLKTTSDL
jgi:hypothetical protein